MFKNKDLYSFHLQLEGIKTNIVYQLLFGKVKQFYQNNAIRINTLIEKIDAMQNEYFVMEEERVKTTEDGKPVMLEGKNYDEYLAKYNELMEKDCPIKFN